jgi:hypothetical protein
VKDLDPGLKLLAKRVRKLEVLPRGGGGAGGDRHIIQDEGVDLPDQPRLNFIGAGVTATDNPLTLVTDVTIPGGVGVETFLELLDTPNTYAGSGGYFVVVNATETGLVFELVSPGAFELNRIWVFQQGSPAVGFDVTTLGLELALLASIADDIVDIPAGVLVGDFWIPSGVEVKGKGRDNTIIEGTIYGEEYSILSSVLIKNYTESSESLYGIIAPSTGIYAEEEDLRTCFQVVDCSIKVYNSGTGNSYGFTTEAGGELYLEKTSINSNSNLGEGYAGIYDASFWHKHGTAHGSTNRFVRA